MKVPCQEAKAQPSKTIYHFQAYDQQNDGHAFVLTLNQEYDQYVSGYQDEILQET